MRRSGRKDSRESTRTVLRSTPRCTTPSLMPRTTRPRRGRRQWMKCSGPGTAGAARCSDPPWFASGAEVAPQREWFEKDYYQTLGVSSTATDKEITRAYRKLAKQFHPDANPGSEDRFKEISAAYDVLGDAPRRKEHDEVRRLGPMAGGFGGPGGGAGGFGGPGGGTFRVEDL